MPCNRYGGVRNLITCNLAIALAFKFQELEQEIKQLKEELEWVKLKLTVAQTNEKTHKQKLEEKKD
jgi:hypothetical protein